MLNIITEECIICFNDKPIEDFICFSCSHKVCLTCYPLMRNICPVCRFKENDLIHIEIVIPPPPSQVNEIREINYCKIIPIIICILFCCSIMYIIVAVIPF